MPAVLAPFPSPVDAAYREESLLRRLLLAPGGWLWRLRRIPLALVERAISIPAPWLIETSEPWRVALAWLRGAIAEPLGRLYRRAERAALVSIPVIGTPRVIVPSAALLARAATLASTAASERALYLASSLDAEARFAMRRLLAGAASRHLLAPSPENLRRLALEVRPQLGLTGKQVERIQAWSTRARAAGVSATEIGEHVRAQVAAGLDLRARSWSSAVVTRGVNAGRLLAYEEAMAAGELDRAKTVKRWRDVGDDRVRASHRAQTRAGWIPFDAVFALQGVDWPPSRDEGCRCWGEVGELE